MEKKLYQNYYQNLPSSLPWPSSPLPLPEQKQYFLFAAQNINDSAGLLSIKGTKTSVVDPVPVDP
jgi:hypothetical protein